MWSVKRVMVVSGLAAIVALSSALPQVRQAKGSAGGPERLAILVEGAPGPIVNNPPISVSATVNNAQCDGNPVNPTIITAVVTDVYGMPLSDAVVSGVMQQTATWTNFAFPLTDDNGSTSTPMSAGRPRGGGSALFTVHAIAGGYTADTSTSCTSP